jgi:2-phospho-L-lactate/phosphoenolpyruvate guanylyltransferase
MKTVLLPVKDFRDAKQRLASVLSPQQRANLAHAMLADVLDALSAAGEPSRIVVYTASESVVRAVRPFGFEVMREIQVNGHSAAVNSILPKLTRDAERVLVIASDLPFLTASDIDCTLTVDCPTVAILPSRDRTGTNGFVLTPPSAITADYGEGSFSRHMKAANNAGLNPVILHIAGVAFDIDTPEDLHLFSQDPRLESETWQFLKHVRYSSKDKRVI